MNTDQNEPREGTVESKVAEQLKRESEQNKVKEILKRYSLRELCDFVFMKANECGDRIKITIRAPLLEKKKGKTDKKDKKKKKS